MHVLQKKLKRERLLEKRLLELRRLSEEGRQKLREALKEQQRLFPSGPPREELPSAEQTACARQLGGLVVKISNLQKQSQRLRERLQLLDSPLRHVLSPGSGEDEVL